MELLGQRRNAALMIAQNMLEREECARGMEIVFQEEGNQKNVSSVVEISDDGEEGEQND